MRVGNKIEELYDKNKEGIFTTEEIGILKQLEGRKDSLLLKEKHKWRLKSRALWLEVDRNTKYFHSFASH